MGEVPVESATGSCAGDNQSALAIFLLRLTFLTALAHLGILLMRHHIAVASNLVQVLAALLSVATCILCGSQARTPHNRRAWWQLAGAFSIWTTAQCIYTVQLALHRVSVSPSFTDALWLTFAFPLLLVAAMPLSESRRELADCMDVLQASLLFSILFALVFRRTAGLPMAVAYDVQSLAMVLTVALRYSTTHAEPERRFFRNLLSYTALYAGCSALGYLGPFHHLPPGGIIDLCWSAPFLLFNGLALSQTQPREPKHVGFFAPSNLLSLSALALTGMSILAASVLTRRNPWLGGLCTAIACGLFALRTYLREAQLRAAQLGLEYAAHYDPLTGLANREIIRREIERQSSAAPGADGLQGAVIFLDLDRFKTLNDGLGHSFGDRVLVEMARRLRNTLGKAGVAGRYGGDEFVVVLRATTALAAEELAQTLLAAIRSPIVLDQRTLHITASLGIVMMDAESSSADLLRDADCAMYRAKNFGKDRIEFFAPAMRSAVEQRLQLEADLHAALAAHSLEVHYQPIYSLPGRMLLGFEALVRWNHPERGMISPADFIPLAEETALIQPLGKLVLRDACFRLQAWNAAYDASLSVNVNVSARQFDDPGLLDIIHQALSDAGLAPERLKLEITESALLTAHPSVQSVLADARRMGIEICLDDFGTGYSSLSYLLDYPFDIVKIDQSFVRNLNHDPARAELVRTVIHLSTNLHKQVIAEGVESEEEIAWLSALHCHMVQGYLLARPLDPSMVDALLESLWPHRALLQNWAQAPESAIAGRRSTTLFPTGDGSITR